MLNYTAYFASDARLQFFKKLIVSISQQPAAAAATKLRET